MYTHSIFGKISFDVVVETKVESIPDAMSTDSGSQAFV